jgi:hypothetical protein
MAARHPAAGAVAADTPAADIRIGYARCSTLIAVAEQIVRSFHRPDDQARALAEVAMVAITAGDMEQAERIARTIRDPSEQAKALTRVAEIGGFPQAGRLMGSAFALGSAGAPAGAG